MEELKRDLGYWLYLDIDNNDYLNKLYCKLVFQYTNSLLKQEYYLEDKEICHLQRFADILSKSNDVKKSSFHKNIAQNIVCILNKLYPDNELNNIYMGTVLSSVNNYVGLNSICKKYRNPDFIENIYENIVKESYRLPEICGEDIFFDASQGIAFENIKNKQFYSFSGPTSMGKTFLVKMFIKEQIVRGIRNNYVIVVPSKALINEVKSEIISVMGGNLYEKGYKVITTPGAISSDKNTKYIMVYTQERLSYQIKVHPEVIIDYLFVDEAQKISEVGTRSAYFYNIIDYMVKCNQEMRICFLCPYIPNPDVYLNLIPIVIDNKFKSDIFEFSPVNQHKIILNLDNSRLNIFNDLSRKFQEMDLPNGYKSISDVVYKIGNGKSNIVFCDSKDMVEQQAIEYWRKCGEDNSPELKKLIEDIKAEIHPKSYLVYFLKKGICCHVGYLPSTIKAKIEDLFRKRIIKTIFCTSTLLEGVNLPADNLFIVIKNSSYILKNSADFKNLMGRVGRKTYNLIGNVYIVPEKGSSFETFERCIELIQKPVENQKLSIDEILDDKLRIQILKCLYDGTGIIEKGNMTYEKFGMARFIVNILIKSICKGDTSNYIFKKFENDLSEELINSVKNNFDINDISDDSNITVDQIRNLDEEIVNNRIFYPTIIDYSNTKQFLENLYELYNWKKYEPKTGLGKKERLSYYAVLLNQWMQGHSIKRIIDKSIEYHKGTGRIYDKKQKRQTDYIGNNSQDNQIVVECLTSVEDVLLFSISNYFTKFSERYKTLKNIDTIDNDWSEYIDFRTNNKLIIELQKIGFSREIAKLIESKGKAMLVDGKIIINKNIYELNNEQLLSELNDVKLNYTELFL